MYKEIKSGDAAGKTFKALLFGYNADAVIVFEDGTFFYLKAGDYFGAINLEEATFSLNHFPGDKLIECGICTREEIEERDRLSKEKRNQEEKERRRRYFEELKKEFLAD